MVQSSVRRRKITRLKEIFSTGLVGVVVVLAVALVSLRLLGFKSFTIMSGSMEPKLSVGSLIFVKPTDPNSLESNDIITFLTGKNTIVTHRIVEKTVSDENGEEVFRFSTKGDANDVADQKTVRAENVVGKVTFSIPFMGYVSNNLQKPYISYLVFVLGAVLILSVVFSDNKPEKTTRQRRSRKLKPRKEEIIIP